jgi:hypothetical protein
MTTATVVCVWIPDVNMISIAASGRYDIRDLTGPDRAWVVAGLCARGLTADESAKLLHCSLRLIRQIRAEPMTRVAYYAIELAQQMEQREHDHQVELEEAAMQVYHAERNASLRKRQRDDLIDALAKGRQKNRRPQPIGQTA